VKRHSRNTSLAKKHIPERGVNDGGGLYLYHHFSTVMNHPFVKQDDQQRYTTPKPWQGFVGRYGFNVTVYKVDFILKKALADAVRRFKKPRFHFPHDWKAMPDRDKFQPYCEAVISGKYTFSHETRVWGDNILGVYRAIEELQRVYSRRRTTDGAAGWKQFCFYRNDRKDLEVIDDTTTKDVNPFNFHAFWKATDPEAEHWLRWCHEERGFANLVFYVLDTKYECKQDELDIEWMWVLDNLFPAYRYMSELEDIDSIIRD
jgi:hypothetical protein